LISLLGLLRMSHEPAIPSGARGRISSLVVDLYELTMAQSYVDEGMTDDAVFSLFVHRLPPHRGYLMAAGLDDVLSYLEGFAFSDDELAFLERTGRFTTRLLDRLRTLRFTGLVRALPEGTIFFPEEPILEVTGPVIEAQLVESVVINLIQLQTMVASKAARCVTAARGRQVVDFALRRTHGPETSVDVARASFVAGFDGTSNVRASQLFGIPPAGTMAHSYVEAFPDELSAFRAYARAFPDSGVLLLDTYDTVQGARHAAIVGKELATAGHHLGGVRLDSGDLVALSRVVREILDDAGLHETIILTSGNLDEHAIEAALAAGAPIDGFGVGTLMGVSADRPYLEIAYKLVSYAGRPTLKLSTDKVSWPGAKQVWRTIRDGQLLGDWIGLQDEPVPPGAQPLLQDMMQSGKRLGPAESLDAIRARARQNLAALPADLLRLTDPGPYSAKPTPALDALRKQATAAIHRQGL
jgi:nicotinate phosphoribosyltransferase